MRESISVAWRLSGELFRIARLETVIYIMLIFPAGLAPSIVVRMVENIVLSPLYLAGLGFFIFLDSLVYPLTSFVSGNMMDKYMAFMVNRLMDKVNQLKKMDVFEKGNVYTSLDMVRRWGDMIPSMFLSLSYSITRNALTIVGILLVLLRIHPLIPLLILAGVFPYGIIRKRFYEQSWGAIYSSAMENYYMGHLMFTMFDFSRMHEIITYRGADIFRINYFRAFDKYFGRIKRVRGKYSLMGTGALVLSALAIVLSMLLAGSTSVVIPAILSLIYLQKAVVELVDQVSSYETYVRKPYARILDFLDLPSPREGTIRSIPSDYPYSIEVENLRFSYSGGKEVIKGVSFRIRDGERVAIVGDNGAGKTTLMKLLLRLYDPSAGKIRIFGNPIEEWDIYSLRRIISVSFQDFGKFKFPLGDNIAFAFPEKYDDKRRIRRAMGMSNIDFLEPDAMIGRDFGGIELSAGQWQRIAVARGFFRMDENTRIVLIDEPTENLDPITEYEIFRKIMEASRGRTLILITHRLWSVRDADRIIVMQEGRVVEEGSHEELLKRNGNYARMWRKQLEKYGLA